MILKKKDIILISNQMMDDRYWTSKQYITKELIKGNRVLYVEANYSFGKLISGLLGKKWPVTPFGKLKTDQNNLFILTPFPRLPFRNHFRWVGYLNQKLLRFKILKAVKKLNFDNPILWTFLHQTANLIGKLDEKASIYHCVDDWPFLLPNAGMGKPFVIRSDEKKLISKVDFVIRVSPKLLTYTDLSDLCVTDIPNGVDTDLFDPDLYKNLPIPEDLSSLPKPIIGFSGSIGKWVDIDLICETAKHFNNGSLVLIGLNEKNPYLRKLVSLNNVHFLGMKKREDVPKYIQTFDICLMPFAKGKIGEGLVPLKMFEYMAMGKPIAAVSSNALKPFKEILYCSESNDYIKNMEFALSDWDEDKSQSSRKFAMEYSWQNRILKYDLELGKIINYDKDLR